MAWALGGGVTPSGLMLVRQTAEATPLVTHNFCGYFSRCFCVSSCAGRLERVKGIEPSIYLQCRA